MHTVDINDIIKDIIDIMLTPLHIIIIEEKHTYIKKIFL